MSGRALVFGMCAAEVVSLLPLAAYPALLPVFIAEWGLSGAEAGWIGGIFHFGYMLAVPFLVGLTDRIDARRVFLAGTALMAVACLGFALSAEGFWSGLGWQMLAGAGLAGTYMPGLKALTDRLPGGAQSRSITIYTANYSVGISLSFLVAGGVGAWLGWRAAFAAVAAGPLLGFAVVALLLRAKPPEGPVTGWLPDFRPVLRNREAMGYILAYGGHGYELMAFRAWLVAYLGFAAAQQALEPSGLWSPAAVATATALLGLPASIVGNEMALRFGRRRTIAAIMAVSALVACAAGFLGPLSYGLAVAMVLLYSLAVSGDSGSLTAGVVATAPASQRGTTMALHSTIGFGLASLGPTVAGVALDLGGGAGSRLGWGIAFVAIGLGSALGPLALWWSGRGRA